MRSTAITAIIVSMVLSVSVLGQPNLILNGDFETPVVGTTAGHRDYPTVTTHSDWDAFIPAQVPGWTIEISGDDGGPPGPDLEFWNLNMGPSYSGSQYVELDGFDPTKISQVVSTIPEATYELSYAWRPRPGIDCQMKVWVDGVEVGDHSGTTGDWTHVTYSFTATSSSTSIAFAEVGPDDQQGMLLDAVSLVIVPIVADIDIKPETLNLNSKGKFTAFIDLPEGCDEEDIDTTTIVCEGAPAVKAMMADDGRLIVKFNREDLGSVPVSDAVELTVTGLLTDGTPFEGSDTIRVIGKGSKK